MKLEFFKTWEILSRYTLLKQKFGKTQLQKVCFIKMTELKLTQVELFSFFNFKSVVVSVSELFYVAL